MYFSKYNKSSVFFLKKYQNCYLLFSNRVIESLIFSLRYICYLDLGFNTLITYKTLTKFRNTALISVNHLDLLFEYLSLNHNFTNKKKFMFSYVWFFIKKCYINCCYLKGMFLNNFEDGYCIGICGIVGFLFQNKNLLTNFDKKTNTDIFFITRLNFLNKTFVVSQENILKQSTRIFFKLTVSLNYTSKNKDVFLADISKRLQS